MLFFALIAAVTLVAWLASRLGVPGLDDVRACMRWGLSLGLIATSLDHFAHPERYWPMIPAYLPLDAEIVLLTGICELAGAAGILVPQLRRLAGIMLAIYFVCVFPANIKNAVEGLTVEGLPSASWYYWVRLAFQPLIIWWTLYATDLIDWPFRRRVRA